MLDYYSNYAGPTKEEAIKELIKATGNEKIVREKMEGETIGSYTGWYSSMKQEKIKEIKEEIYRVCLLESQQCSEQK